LVRHYKLYHFPLTRSARVRWALYETVGNDIEIEVVELFKGKHYEPDYLKKNPNHHVPLLEITLDNGSQQHMIESVAMADTHPPGLVGRRRKRSTHHQAVQREVCE